MKRLSSTALKLVMTIVITIGIARVLGAIPFAPWATDLLIRFAALFGAYGDEQVEDVYAIASLLAALACAVALVWTVKRLRRGRRA